MIQRNGVTIRKAPAVQGETYVRTNLTNFSQRYVLSDENHVAHVTATNVPVLREAGTYTVYPRGYFWRDQLAPRPLGGRPVQATFKVAKESYSCEEYALEGVLDDRETTNQEDPINLEENLAELLQDAQMIRADRMWGDAFFTPGVWTNDYVGGGVDFDYLSDASTDVMVLIEEKSKLMAKTTGKRPNKIVVGANVDTALVNHPLLLERIKRVQRAVLTGDLLASLFRVESYRVAMSIYNAAAEGADDDIDWICDPNSFWLGYVSPTPALNSVTAIARFAWTGLIPGSTKVLGGVMSQGRDGRAYSNYYHTRNAFGLKVAAPDLGMLFSNAVPEPTN